jgi:hypothetical protein
LAIRNEKELQISIECFIENSNGRGALVFIQRRTPNSCILIHILDRVLDYVYMVEGKAVLPLDLLGP